MVSRLRISVIAAVLGSFLIAVTLLLTISTSGPTMRPVADSAADGSAGDPTAPDGFSWG